MTHRVLAQAALFGRLSVLLCAACQGAMPDRTSLRAAPDEIPVSAFLALVGDRSSDPGRLHCLSYRADDRYVDPPPGVVRGVREAGVAAEAASTCRLRQPQGADEPVTEVGTGRPVYLLSLEDSLRATREGFELAGRSYCGKLCAASGVIRLRRVGRAWRADFVVVGVE